MSTFIGRGGRTAAGSGSMPTYMLTNKFEHTQMLEDPHELDTYRREMLQYSGPDPELFADEAPRRNLMSESRINLRTEGARSALMPYHPDLFIGFTDRDPRGTATGPDMRKYVDQTRYRGKYTRYYKDDDFSVPESGRNEQQVIRDRRKGFYELKNRWQNFSTSADGRAGGRPLGAKHGRDINNVEFSGETADLNYGTTPHRGDKTAILSNYVPMGWDTTTDHTFGVAEYGKLYSSVKAGDVNIRGIRDRVETDGEKMVQFEDGWVPKSLVAQMKRIATEQSQDPGTVNDKIRSLRLGPHQRPSSHQVGDTLIDHDVVESMAVAASRPGDIGDIGVVRRMTQRSAAPPIDEKLGVMITSSHGAFTDPDKHRRNALVSDISRHESTTFDYSQVAPVRQRRDMSMNTHANAGRDFGDDIQDNKMAHLRANGRDDKSRVNRTQIDTEFKDTGSLNRSVGVGELKTYTRGLMRAEELPDSW